jgi:ABC-type Mn2+/Zn2+ transport system ATPase subunit
VQGDVVKQLTVVLSSPVATSFRCVKAANSLDIDASKKAEHRLTVTADVESSYNVGLIVGASGSGKTTLAKKVWGEDCFRELLDPAQPVIDQFPEEFTYDECAAMLAGVGLTSVVCWIRPAVTLSNGQRARAECALQMARQAQAGEVVVIDEWTSVVDRTVAKVMSHCIAKHARKTNKRIVLASCHYDVVDWLNPDWIIDCNKQSYVDRRSLCRSWERSEKLQFDIREVGTETWRYFSKYHYLSENLPGGVIKTFGLFNGDDQIGFQCFANYVPWRDKMQPMKMHSNRTVIHPDYAGLGMGIALINATSEVMVKRGFDVRAKFSSAPIYLSMKRQACWKLQSIERKTKTVVGGNMLRRSGFREDVKTYSFKYIPQT